MNNIISAVEKKGMKFNEIYSKNDSISYLKYNTCWQELKQSRNLLYIKNGPKKYENIFFSDIKSSGMVHYYFNESFNKLIKEFEHGLKVYMSDVYEEAQLEEKENIIDQVRHINFKYLKNIDELKINNFFYIYEKATLSELLKIYKKMKQKIKSFELINIEKKISRIRNYIFHHNNILVENTANPNTQCDEKRLNYLVPNIEENELKYLLLNYNHNTLRILLELMDVVNYFLSRSQNTQIRKKESFEEFKINLYKSYKEYKKIQPKDWIDIYYNVLNKKLKIILDNNENDVNNG